MSPSLLVFEDRKGSEKFLCQRTFILLSLPLSLNIVWVLCGEQGCNLQLKWLNVHTQIHTHTHKLSWLLSKASDSICLMSTLEELQDFYDGSPQILITPSLEFPDYLTWSVFDPCFIAMARWAAGRSLLHANKAPHTDTLAALFCSRNNHEERKYNCYKYSWM